MWSYDFFHQISFACLPLGAVKVADGERIRAFFFRNSCSLQQEIRFMRAKCVGVKHKQAKNRLKTPVGLSCRFITLSGHFSSIDKA